VTRRLLLALLVVGGAAACAPKRPATPSPPPASELIVLLPDAETGAVGRALVTSSATTVTLAGEREGTQVAPGQPPTMPAAVDEARLQQVFGDALSALPPPPRSFNLYFQFDSDELTDAARALLPEILRLVKERAVPDVVAIGHTDTAGSSQSNFQLGLRRATKVRDLLIATGLDAALITVMSAGEAEPLVKTPDETREPRNRRVEVAIR
jgi:outer membrane protein OmpA-like peptidoglycan-associated protein